VFNKTDEPAQVARSIKSFLSGWYNNKWLEYSISKLRSRFVSLQVAKVLAPAALSKHKETLSVPVPRVPDSDLKRTVQLTRTLLSGVSFNFDRIPRISQKGCLEVSASGGGKKKALASVTGSIFLDTVAGIGLPTVVVSTEEGSGSVPFCPAWRNETLASWSKDYDRESVEAAIAPGPLKARVITKETKGSIFLESIRRGVWECLRKSPVFLIDGPPSVDDIPRRLPDEIYVSGDYTAATDGFHPEVSEVICGVIGDLVVDQLHEESRETDTEESFFDSLEDLSSILKRTMTGKTIFYPDGSSIAQRRGQLMGNLLSFPVLCIYNYVVWHIAMEREHGSLLPLQNRIRINGDDILFPATNSRYKVWTEECDRLGMELNCAKTELSERKCSLNSTLFAERNGILQRVYAHRVYGPEVPESEARRLRAEEKEKCGENAPGSSLFLHEMSLEKTPEILREEPTLSWDLHKLWDSTTVLYNALMRIV